MISGGESDSDEEWFYLNVDIINIINIYYIEYNH